MSLLHLSIILNYQQLSFNIVHGLFAFLKEFTKSQIKELNRVSTYLKTSTEDILTQFFRIDFETLNKNKTISNIKCCFCDTNLELVIFKKCQRCQKEFDFCYQKNKPIHKSNLNKCQNCQIASLSKKNGKKCPYCKK